MPRKIATVWPFGADVVVRLGPLVAEHAARDDQRDDHEADADQPDDPAAARASPVFLDELVEVLLGLRLEVAVFVLGRLERMQQQRRQAQRAACGVALERQRARGGADDDAVGWTRNPSLSSMSTMTTVTLSGAPWSRLSLTRRSAAALRRADSSRGSRAILSSET